jgi:hypothetical protein
MSRPLQCVAAVACLLLVMACNVPKAPNMTRRRYSNLREIALRDLGCSPEKYEYVGDDIHRMYGCGKQEDYVLYCPGTRVCTWLPSPRPQAAFEMNCPEHLLTLTQLTKTSYGIEGCNRRRSYSLSGESWIGQNAAGDGEMGSENVPPTATPIFGR